jgi:serine/threonine protein phosphatase PrpC
MLCFEFWTEKRLDLGEDAPPTLEMGDDDTWLLAVFDGLGGAGSTPYTIVDSGKVFSGAYLASRCAKAVCEAFFKLWDKEANQNFALGLQEALKYSFTAYRQELYAPESRLKSKLIKTLPTTIAGILLEENRHDILPTLQATAFWAGDSRCYYWQKDEFMQISVDDLSGNPDALQNLRLDATITNCVHVEGNFIIHHTTHHFGEPTIFLVATDGCFGYVPTPMHFEFMLLETLMKSHYDMEDWAEKLKEALLAITGDDMSIALTAWGFQHLEHIKSYFYPRYEELQRDFIEIWENASPPREEIENILWSKYQKAPKLEREF